jgi:hypothetical protein
MNGLIPAAAILERVADSMLSVAPDFAALERLAAPTRPAPKRSKRKTTLAGALKQASKAGAKVRGATMAADGSVSLQFGEPQTEQTNDLDKWMAKHHAN